MSIRNGLTSTPRQRGEGEEGGGAPSESDLSDVEKEIALLTPR